MGGSTKMRMGGRWHAVKGEEDEIPLRKTRKTMMDR